MDQQADANEQEVDDVCILQSRQFNVHGGNAHEVPKLGMEFDSEQHAFDYYSEYAHRVGFSVRKHHVKKRDGIVTRRTLCCSKQELKSEFKMRQTSPVLIANVEMLRHAVEVQGKSQESIGKRYSYLSHDFQELVTLAAENEDMYIYAHQNLSKLLKDLEEMKKTYCCSTLDPDTNTQDDLLKNVPQLNDGVVSQCPRGIKRKATVGRPRKRFKDPLEQSRRHKSQVKATQGTSNNGRGSQQKGRKIGRQNEHQEEHSEKEDEIFTDVYSKVNDEHDIADDTLPLQSQASSISYHTLQQHNQEDNDSDKQDGEGGG
ncbi:hypothetical protein RJ640_010790 [Escallonia rubra]|uniref:FAR1 domain-containing protein n=1 Tax=Escallonia rubra TaxID=112253 RepID=A0AA88RBJ3_9ASTE|nr:hypothetical protein RJ640_010790 [Escallonia rubra]